GPGKLRPCLSSLRVRSNLSFPSPWLLPSEPLPPGGGFLWFLIEPVWMLCPHSFLECAEEVRRIHVRTGVRNRPCDIRQLLPVLCGPPQHLVVDDVVEEEFTVLLEVGWPLRERLRIKATVEGGADGRIV